VFKLFITALVALRVPVVTPVDRLKVAALILLLTIFVLVSVPTVAVVTFAFVNWAAAEVIPVAKTKIPPVIDVAASVPADTVVPITLVPVMDVLLIFVAVKEAVVTPVDRLKVPALRFVLTRFVDVILVVLIRPVVILVVKRAVPVTSNVAPGLVVAIPTLPPVVKMLPNVFELNDALIPPPVTNILPLVILLNV